MYKTDLAVHNTDRRYVPSNIAAIIDCCTVILTKEGHFIVLITLEQIQAPPA